MRPDDLDPREHAYLEQLAAQLREPVELSDRVERKVLARLRTGAGPVPVPVPVPVSVAGPVPASRCKRPATARRARR
jgi:hypothetical protein